MPEHISFSQLSTVAKCGEMYRRKYVLGERGGTSMPAIFGSAIHGAIDVVESALWVEGKRPHWGEFNTEILKIAKVLAKAEVEAMRIRGVALTDIVYYGRQDFSHWMLEKTPLVVQQYTEWRQEETQRGVKWAGDPAEFCEFPIDVTIAGHKFIGFIDGVMRDRQGRTFIRDVKTGKPSVEHAMQLEVYRCGFKQATGIDPAYGQVLYVNDKGTKPEVVKFNLGDTDVHDIAARLVNLIETGSYIMNGPFTGACDWCDFKSDCPGGAVTTRGIA